MKNQQQEELRLIEDQLWSHLQQGVINHRSAFHTASLVSVYNNLPYARTVVLRMADEAGKMLRFHTDVRSSKIIQLQQNPAVCWLFYSKEERCQLRLQATAAVHTNDAITEEAWQRSRTAAKMCYTTSSGPGTIIEAPEAVDFNQPLMTNEQLDFARKNFAVVQTTILTADCLLLHHSGHKRIFINYATGDIKWLQV